MSPSPAPRFSATRAISRRARKLGHGRKYGLPGIPSH
jgi:hypothetical protein